MKIDRKNVSHILVEDFDGNKTVSMIVHHEGIWSYHATSHALRKSCDSGAACLDLLKKLDAHLVSGKRLGLYLKGSSINDIKYY